MEKISKDNRWIIFGLMFLITMMGLTRFFIVLSADRVPLAFDALELHNSSVLLSKSLQGEPEAWELFLKRSDQTGYPPLIHYTALPFIFLFGPKSGPQVSLSVYLVILLLSTYGIARIMAGKKAGIFAAALILITPHLDAFSRLFLVDVPLTAFTTMTIFLLLKSENFTRRGYTVLLGLSICLGMLTKQTFAFYLAFPVVFFSILCMVRCKEDDRRPTMINLGLFVILATAIPLIYYIPRLGAFWDEQIRFRAFLSEVRPYSYQLHRYLVMLIKDGAGPVIALGALIGLFRNVSSRPYWIVVFWLAPPLLFLDALHPFPSYRYLLPLLPATAILFATGFCHFAEKLPSRSATTMMVITLIVVFLAFSADNLGFGNEDLPFKGFYERQEISGMPRPQSVDWSGKDAARPVILEESKNSLIFLLHSPYTESIKAHIWEERPIFKVVSPFDELAKGRIPESLKNEDGMAAYFRDADWVAFHSEYKLDSRYLHFTYPIQADLAYKIIDYFFEIKSQFALVDRFKYPEGGGELLLYERSDEEDVSVENQKDVQGLTLINLSN